ncbi:MAG: glycoside hydrolase family 95 protein [Bacteroidales bacterium]|jgi:alpha-L-fucosidase 2|nr:glycoside hydrolase family 95 protein [Bacteroidales bacterium]
MKTYLKYFITTFYIAAIITSCSKKKEVSDLRLWYNEPAAKWTEALPIGNGRLGAMVFGTPGVERLQLNEETVWAGQPNSNSYPEALQHLPQVRKLLFEKKWKEAQDFVDAKMFPRNDLGFNQGMPYQPVGDIELTFPGHENPEKYCRELDLSTAITTTRYTVDGVEYTREAFASAVAQVIVMRITASQKGKLSFTAKLTSPHSKCMFGSSGGASGNAVQWADLLLNGTAGDFENLEGKVKFTALTKVVADVTKDVISGNTHSDDKSASADFADINAVTVYISMASNFTDYNTLSTDEYVKAANFLQSAVNKNYEELKKEHIADYQRYFNRVKLDLGVTDSIKKPTDERILEFAKANDPQLAALYFQFGRYLLISSSRPGTQPANLQGVWNDLMTPPWDSKYTSNINLEMNYWPAEVTNLPELHEPLIELIKDVSVTGARTAREMYGTRGWVMHHNTDIWRITGPVDYAQPGMWPVSEAWLSQHLWERYLYSGDRDYLKEVYPLMRGAAEFLLDFMIPEPEHGWLVVAPSNSPENSFDKQQGTTNTYGVTMDVQLAFELFGNVISAAQTLGIDNAFADTLRQAVAKLPPMHIGKHGQLQEWLFDWDDPNDHHRHVSHLYGVFPSNLISPTRTPELFDAARRSLNYRGDPATGWSMGWKVCLWARFRDGNRAYKLITDQIRLCDSPKTNYKGGGTYANLFDACPPYQIDGNFGCTAGIAEMLMQSHDGAVHLLPAIPDVWNKGSVNGLRTRGGFVIEELTWENGVVKTLKIKSTLGGNLRLRSAEELTNADGSALAKATGDNPNPFFATPAVPQPVISPEAKLTAPNVKPVHEYDIPTEVGGIYSFR